METRLDTKRKYDRAWYAQLPQVRKDRKVELQKLRRHAIRKVVDDYKRQRRCACGEADIRCLEFHHPKSDKEITVADATRNGWSVSRVMAEIAKCVLLCANCHRKLHYTEA